MSELFPDICILLLVNLMKFSVSSIRISVKYYFKNNILNIFSSQWTTVRPNKDEKSESRTVWKITWNIEKSIFLKRCTWPSLVFSQIIVEYPSSKFFYVFYTLSFLLSNVKMSVFFDYFNILLT